jgi:CRP-like cAMP-binding protein|tara:strand:+ start:534 stop:938 length:405 start_codon:yes stop_codon:yes gene_type:complete
MSANEIAEMLSRELKALEDSVQDPMTLEWKQGEVIIDKGKMGNYMYLIAGGEVEIRTDKEVLETVGKNGIVGEMALIDSPMRSATVVAATDVILTPIDKWKFLFLVQKYPEFALFIMEVMSRRLRMMNERLEDG